MLWNLFGTYYISIVASDKILKNYADSLVNYAEKVL